MYVAIAIVVEIIKMYPSIIGRFLPIASYVALAPIHTPFSDPQLVVYF